MASGDTLAVFKPADYEPEIEVLDLTVEPTQPALGASDETIPHLAFDGATNQSNRFSGILNRAYSGGGVTVRLHMSMALDTTGDVDWDVAFERVTSTRSESFATANSTDNTTVPASVEDTFIVEVTFTDGVQMDSVTGGDFFRIEVTRDAANDTATGDAYLIGIEIKET